MRPSDEEQMIRKVALNVVCGLGGCAEHKLAKRLEQAMPYGKEKIVETLTIIERHSGLGWRPHKMVAMAKKVIGGDLSWASKLEAEVAYANGMGPMPEDEPN